MSELRILQFITPAGFYGAERWVLALVRNLKTGRLICDLAVTRENADQDLSVADHFPAQLGQVHYIQLAGRFDFRAVSRLCAIIREREIDIIHTHGYKSDILGLLAARLTGIRCVSTPHGFAGKVSLKLATFIRIGCFMLRFFDAVVPLSEELVKDMERLRVSPQRTRLIINGVDLSEIDEELNLLDKKNEDEAEKLDQQTIRIGFVGQMIPRKGIGDLLALFDELYQHDPRLRLVLAGDGAQRPELERQAAALPSAGAIEFLGFRTDRVALMRTFDLFVMTSSLEGIPRCLMEAMAVGVPVVAYGIPGVDQLIEPGITGLTAPLGDRAGLAACCREVIDEPDQARVRAEAARDLIEREYSAARMAQEYQALFAELKDHGKLLPSATGSSF